MSEKQHLTDTGFNTILALYASRGISPNVLAVFPNIVPVDKISVVLPKYLNPY
jgi:hypothetical protein